MKWTTDEAFEKVQEAGITHNRFVFLKMVRDGRIPGKLISKKRGYRFEEGDIMTFIQEFEKDETFHMGEAFEALKKENEELKKRLKMPKDYWLLENQALKQLLEKKEEEIRLLNQKILDVIEDKTIRVRVE